MITSVHFLMSGIGDHGESISEGETMVRQETREQGALILPFPNSPLS